MPSKYIKKGWNPNSGKNLKLAPSNIAHELGNVRKTYYKKKGFNQKSLANLLLRRERGKTAGVSNKKRNEQRQKNREARNAERTEEKNLEAERKERMAQERSRNRNMYQRCIEMNESEREEKRAAKILLQLNCTGTPLSPERAGLVVGGIFNPPYPFV